MIFAAASWSIASALARKLPLPSSKTVSSGAQMLMGGVFLAVAAALFGQLSGFDPRAVSAKAWVALLYLIVPGSIILILASIAAIMTHLKRKDADSPS
mgnify:CR=1 FL=1